MSRWIGIAALALCCLAPAQDDDISADDEPQKTTSTGKEKKIPKNLKPVASVIAGMDTVNAKPNLKAKYYIYLSSASWCGPCRALMPKIVEIYPAMKKKGVEILLLGADKNVEEVKQYAKSHKCKFPAIWGNDPLVRDLPGLEGGAGIPWAVYVTADGEQLGSVAANNPEKGILQWESIFLGKKATPHKKKK